MNVWINERMNEVINEWNEWMREFNGERMDKIEGQQTQRQWALGDGMIEDYKDRRSKRRHHSWSWVELIYPRLSRLLLSDWSNTAENDSPDNDADAVNQSNYEKVINNACFFISHALQCNTAKTSCENIDEITEEYDVSTPDVISLVEWRQRYVSRHSPLCIVSWCPRWWSGVAWRPRSSGKALGTGSSSTCSRESGFSPATCRTCTGRNPRTGPRNGSWRSAALEAANTEMTLRMTSRYHDVTTVMSHTAALKAANRAMKLLVTSRYYDVTTVMSYRAALKAANTAMTSKWRHNNTVALKTAKTAMTL